MYPTREALNTARVGNRSGTCAGVVIRVAGKHNRQRA